MSGAAQITDWQSYHDGMKERAFPRWPTEIMVSALFGGALGRPVRPHAGMRVLDVGCGFGNNLRPFLELGCDCHGVEIAPEIAAVASETTARWGGRAAFETGRNTALPYPDGMFDLLLSVNVLHYEGSEEGIRAGLAEYARVLAPSGVAFIETTGPGHDVFREARRLGPHLYEFHYDDFRRGEIFFYFETVDALARYILETFSAVETGRYRISLPGRDQDYLIAIARKGDR